MEKLTFPEGFMWGTSTSAGQIETAYDHDWKGAVSKDGSVLDRTIDHELRRKEDAGIIASLGNAYRCGCDWSRLQRSPRAELDQGTVDEYRRFFGTLKDQGMRLMLVAHHFANPRWFIDGGSWTSKEAPSIFTDYVAKMCDAFGDLADSWNTINEPNGYAAASYLGGIFPPYRKNPFVAWKVLNTMSEAHKQAYRAIKERQPGTQIGISCSTMAFEGETRLGRIPAAIADKLYIASTLEKFNDSDFVGFSYYGRVPFRPLPIAEITHPGKLALLGKEHDRLWEQYPDGLEKMLTRIWGQYHKPIIITEHGCCTDDDRQRCRSIRDHLMAAHNALDNGVDLRGYFHWSTFDVHEWNLGRSYRFGLYEVHPVTLERKPRLSARLFGTIAKTNALTIENTR